MRNATHGLIGVSLGLVVARGLEADGFETAAVAGAALYGSWLPDADQLGARVHRRSRLERRSLVVAAAGAAARLPLLVFAVVARHRGVSHSLLACGVLLAVAAISAGAQAAGLVVAALAGLALGYCAHVAADACTPAGVGLWCPFARRRVWCLSPALRIPTGSLREGLVAITAAMLVFALLLL